MTSSSEPDPRPSEEVDQPETVSTLYGGRVVLLEIRGPRNGAGSAVRMHRLARMLTARGFRRMLVDLREASYPSDISQICDRIAVLAESDVTWRIAVRLDDRDHPTACGLADAFARAGHIVARVESVEEAKRFFFPPENIHLIG